MLLQIKAGGAVVGLLAATAGVVALTGTVAVAANRVDPAAVVHLSNSPSPSISVIPPVPVTSFAQPQLGDRAAARAALKAPDGYSRGDAADVTSQVEATLDSSKLFTVSGCAVFSNGRTPLIACTGLLGNNLPPQLADHVLLGLKQRNLGGGTLVNAPVGSGQFAEVDAVGSSDSTIVLAEFLYPSGTTLPDSTITSVVTQLEAGLHG